MWATPPALESPDPIEWTPNSPQLHSVSSTQWLGPGEGAAQGSDEQSGARRQLLLEFFQPPIGSAYREALLVKVMVDTSKFLRIKDAMAVKTLATAFKMKWAQDLGQQIDAILQEIAPVRKK